VPITSQRDAFFALAELAPRDGKAMDEATALAEASRQGPIPRRVESADAARLAAGRTGRA
jgi:hypothetical protein